MDRTKMKTQIIQLNDDYQKTLRGLRGFYLEQGLTYGWRANRDLEYDQGHWNKMILSESKMFPYNHDLMPYIKQHPDIQKIWNLVKEQLGDRCLLRCYINSYTYGTDGYAHQDDSWTQKTFGVNSTTETILIYLNEGWHIDWAGETVIYDDAVQEIETSILPKFGRMIIFDSSKWHAARPLSRACKQLRSVLVFKTLDFQYMSKEIEFLLDKTKDLSLSDKPVFEHLFNTMRHLEKNKQSRDVCAAGLFHSIYGAKFYKYQGTSITREIIRDLIGEYAEMLAYEFSTTKDRLKTFVENTNGYNEQVRKDLLSIEEANRLNQVQPLVEKVQI